MTRNETADEVHSSRGGFVTGAIPTKEHNAIH